MRRVSDRLGADAARLSATVLLGAQQVESLRQIRHPAVGTLDVSTVGRQLAADDAQQGRLACTVAAGERDAFGTADRQIDIGEQRPAAAMELQTFGLHHRSSGGHIGVRQLQDDHVVVSKCALGLVETGLRVGDARRVDLVDSARGFLRIAFPRPGDDLRQPGILEVARSGGRPLGRAFAGLLHFALLAFEVLFGVADVALGDPLGRVDHRLVQS